MTSRHHIVKEGEKMHRRIHWLLVCFLLVLAACSTQAPLTYEVVTPASLSPGTPIPPPTADPVLTISGNFSNKNSGDTLVLDLPTIEKLGTVRYAVTDPFENKKITYTGVLMSDLLNAIGAAPNATTIHMVALDDFIAEIKVADLKRWPVLLATRADGELMSVEKGGPTRIIFPYDTHPDIDRVSYRDLWIWNIKTMELR
jgi:hypothetical protein